MAENFLNNVLDLYKENKWKEILLLNKNSDNIHAQKLLWVWPSEKNLNFIKNVIIKIGLNGITSIGCGNGLLEWIIHQSTGFPLIGYEVNEEWWTSKYCNPHFIKLEFLTMPPTPKVLKSKYALLFCYFNYPQDFINYVNCYKGNLILIIGPGEGAGRHTCPEPFNPNFGTTKWMLYDYQEVKETKDFIVAYIKN